MSHDRKEGRRANRRAFRPALEGSRLEARLVLSQAPYSINHFLLTHPQRGFAYKFNNPPFLTEHAPPIRPGTNYTAKGVAATQTARGGQSVIVAQPDGSRFRLSLTLADNLYDGGLAAQTGGTGTNVIPSSKYQAQGTIRAYPMPGGKIGIIIDGSTAQEQLTIDPLPFAQRKGYAHSFAYGEGGRSHILNIGSLNVASGNIQAILGYHSANLSGPLTIGGNGTVDRIAFNSLQPGAAIGVGGTLNTLDIANSATLTSGPGISIGRDLNLLNVGQDLVLTNGASLYINRFLGLTPQPPKGTGTGSNILSVNQALVGTGTSTVVPSVSGYIQGNVQVGPGSTFYVGGGIANSSLINGSQAAPSVLLINGALSTSDATPTNQIIIPNVLAGTQLIRSVNNFFVFNNLVARNGIPAGL